MLNLQVNSCFWAISLHAGGVCTCIVSVSCCVVFSLHAHAVYHILCFYTQHSLSTYTLCSICVKCVCVYVYLFSIVILSVFINITCFLYFGWSSGEWYPYFIISLFFTSTLPLPFFNLLSILSVWICYLVIFLFCDLFLCVVCAGTTFVLCVMDTIVFLFYI